MGQADSARLAVRVATEDTTFGVNPSTGTKAITAATNAAPIVISSAGHGYVSGAVLNVAAVGGNTNANGIWEINVIDANSYSLVGSQGNSAYTSGGTSKAAVFELQITGEGLKANIEKKRSNQIRSDRQGAALVTVASSADGPINFEMLYKEFDFLMAAALQNNWVVYGHRGVGAVFTGTFSAGNILTASVAPSGGSDFTTLKKGQWVQVQGSSIGANNITAQLSKTVAPTTTVLTFEAAAVFTNGGGGAACKISASRLTNGVLPKNWAVEKAYNDVGQIIPYNGMPIDGLELNFAQGDITSGSVALMGKKAGAMITVTALDTPQPANAFEIMNSVSGIQQILRDGLAPLESFMALRLKIANNARKRMAVASVGPVSIGFGRELVSGSLEAYLTDGTRFSKFMTNTPFMFSWGVFDTAGNGYVITVPRARFSDANPNATQADQDVTDPGAFDAEYDSSQAAGSGLVQSIFIDRVGVAV